MFIHNNTTNTIVNRNAIIAHVIAVFLLINALD